MGVLTLMDEKPDVAMERPSFLKQFSLSLGNTLNAKDMLTPSDLHLSTPEIDSMVLENGGVLITPTARPVSIEKQRELYALPFEAAYNRLQEAQQIAPAEDHSYHSEPLVAPAAPLEPLPPCEDPFAQTADSSPFTDYDPTGEYDSGSELASSGFSSYSQTPSAAMDEEDDAYQLPSHVAAGAPAPARRRRPQAARRRSPAPSSGVTAARAAIQSTKRLQRKQMGMDETKMNAVERKRARNRVAATKCRLRKLERIATLEERVALLKGDKADLETTMAGLRDEVSALRDQLKRHLDMGCHIMVLKNEEYGA